MYIIINEYFNEFFYITPAMSWVLSGIKKKFQIKSDVSTFCQILESGTNHEILVEIKCVFILVMNLEIY